MEVNYTIVKDDLPKYYKECEACYKLQQRKSTLTEQLAKFAWYCLFVIPPMIASMAVYWMYPYADWPYVLMLPVCIIWVIVILRFAKRDHAKTMAEYLDSSGPRLTRIDTDGVYQKSDYSEWKVYWTHVSDIVMTSNFIWMLTDRRQLFSVPKRSFEDEAQARQFLDVATISWQKALAPTKGVN